MLGAVRLLGIPMLAVGVVLAVPHTSPRHAPPQASAHAKPAHVGASHARPAWHRPTIVGEWEFGNGFFIFYRRGKVFTDKVVLQRPSAFCPDVNDHDGQIVLHHKPHSRVYTGTWQWFFVSNCKVAGYGPLMIKVWLTNDRATFVSAPPPGLHGTTNIFTLHRPDAGPPSATTNLARAPKARPARS